MIDLVYGDFRTWELRPASLDLVVFDPPWDNDHLPLYRDAGKWAKRHLGEGGVLLAYTGNAIPKTTRAIGKSGLRWQVLLTIGHADGNSPRRHTFRIRENSRHLLMYSQGRYRGPYIPTLLHAHRPEKDHHPWQQSLAPLVAWMKTVLRGRMDATVADLTLGSGTTGVAAKMLGHSFHGCDVDPETLALAQARIESTAYNPEFADSLALSAIPRKSLRPTLGSEVVR